MTFIVNGIKEGSEKKYNVEFLLWVDSVLLAKKILEETGIIVLSLKEFKSKSSSVQEGEDFGNIYFSIYFLQQEVKLVAKFDGDIKSACMFFFNIGFDIVDINSFINPLPKDEVKKIVEESKAENQKKIEEEKKKTLKTIEKEREVYADKRLETDKTIIEWTFAKIEQTINLTKWCISGKELKKLKDKEDEIKKLKLWTNHERIKELIEEIMTMLENMENDYYLANKDQEKRIFPDSIITDMDTEKEIKKLQKVEKLKEIWGKIKSNEQDYIILGKYTIFQKFLIKDIIYLFKTPKHLANIIYNAYDLVEMGIMCIAILITIYTITDIVFLFSGTTTYDYLYQTLIKYGLVGLLIFGSRFLRKKNIPILILLIPWIIVLYYIIINFINNNFSI